MTIATFAQKGLRRVLIINGKGGCGKTTIAINLAVSYARQGHATALMDYDSQAGSTDWSELRSAASNGRTNSSATTSLPLSVIPMHQRAGMYQTKAFSHQLPADVDRIVIDTPSGARERDIDTLIKQCDAILIPMLPSPLDIRSGSRFIAELLTHRSYRANPRPIGVIANRVQHLTQGANQDKLIHALECLGVPCVASFADSTLYGRAAEDGAGITELTANDNASQAEIAKWAELVNWLEAQPRRAQRIAAPPASASHTAVALDSDSPVASSPTT